MSRRIRSSKSLLQIKEEQINFLIKDVGKNLEEYKKALEFFLSDVKKMCKVLIKVSIVL